MLTALKICISAGIVAIAWLSGNAATARADEHVLRIGGTGAAMKAVERLGELCMGYGSTKVEVIPGLGSSGGIRALSEGLIDIAVSGRPLTPEEAANFPPVRHNFVRTNKNNGRKSVLIGAHAKSIVGWPEDRSRALLDGLLARASKPENSFRHEWRDGDVVVWDNQAVVHRATPYDTERFRRVMQRTTISYGGPPEHPVGCRAGAAA